MIEHEVSASGSGDRSASGDRSPEMNSRRRRRRHSRTFALGFLGVLLVVGGFFWRPLAILWCWTVARAASGPDVVAWSCAALADLGPSSLPALARLVESSELQRAWSASAAIRALHARVPEANAPIHDLLLVSSARARSVAGMVLVASDAHDASGLPAVLEGLQSADPQLRFFSALALSSFPGDRFEKEVPDAPRSFVRMARALADGRTDPRRVFVHSERRGVHVHGEWRLVGDVARAALERLDATFESRADLDAWLAAADPEVVLRDARGRGGAFFRAGEPGAR